MFYDLSGETQMTTSPIKLYFVAGERSGDTHGADLIAALKRRGVAVEFRGMGGPKMIAEGGEMIEDWVEEAGVVGLWEVVKNYGYFRGKMDQVVDEVTEWQPDVIVPVDYPGFNLRLAKRLRAESLQSKIVYYISPQVWAWNRGRIPKMAAWLDRMLCIFPFEKALYEESGLKTDFVGHPLVEQLEAVAAEPVERETKLIGLFPGSRLREVSALFGDMVGAVDRLGDEYSDWRVVAVAASEKVAATMRDELVRQGMVERVAITIGDSHGWMQRSTFGVVASGTATLEAAVFCMPYCLVYRVATATFLAAKFLMKVPYLGIVNILAGKSVVEEFLQRDLSAKKLSEWMMRMASNPQVRESLQTELTVTMSKLGTGGAAERAADAILSEIDRPFGNTQ